MRYECKILILGSAFSYLFIFLLTFLSIFVNNLLSNKDIQTSVISKHSDFKELFIQKSCSIDYKDDENKWQGCAPKLCGRGISDYLIKTQEAVALLNLAKHGFTFGRSSGGASILDLHSGALSNDTVFLNIFSLLKNRSELLSPDIIALYKSIKERIKSKIVNVFQLGNKNLYLTKPTFFSQITSDPAKTIHDEYWHRHVDRDTYGSFHYTSLVYLTTYSLDFSGGRFVFTDGNSIRQIIEPKIGRVSFFTSGSENEHYVEKVESGTRYALTVAFTCDPKFAINEPKI